MATSPAGLSTLVLDLDNAMGRQPGASLRNQLFDPIDCLRALERVGVVNDEEPGLALHALSSREVRARLRTRSG
jgi:hypothetical protein